MTEPGNGGAAIVERSTTVQNDRGATKIAESVVSKIAGIAAREVAGVHSLVSHDLSQTVAGLARAVARQNDRSQGVRVQVGTREAAVDLKLSVEYGVNIPDVASAVRESVIDRVQGMTGLTVKEVNVEVVDLYFAPDEAPEPERRVE